MERDNLGGGPNFGTNKRFESIVTVLQKNRTGGIFSGTNAFDVLVCLRTVKSSDIVNSSVEMSSSSETQRIIIRKFWLSFD